MMVSESLETFSLINIFILTDNFSYDDMISVLLSLLCVLCVQLCMSPCVPDTFLYDFWLYCLETWFQSKPKSRLAASDTQKCSCLWHRSPEGQAQVPSWLILFMSVLGIRTQVFMQLTHYQLSYLHSPSPANSHSSMTFKDTPFPDVSS